MLYKHQFAVSPIRVRQHINCRQFVINMHQIAPNCDSNFKTKSPGVITGPAPGSALRASIRGLRPLDVSKGTPFMSNVSTAKLFTFKVCQCFLLFNIASTFTTIGKRLHWHRNIVTILADLDSISHTRTVVRECFKGDGASQWKRPKLDPSPRQNPLIDLHKNWHAWFSPGRHPACKIW